MAYMNRILIGTINNNINIDILSRNSFLIYYFVLFQLHQSPSPYFGIYDFSTFSLFAPMIIKQRPSFVAPLRQGDGRMYLPSRQILRRYLVHQAEEMFLFLSVSKTHVAYQTYRWSLPYACTFCRDDTFLQLTVLACRRLFICYSLCSHCRVSYITPWSNGCISLFL